MFVISGPTNAIIPGSLSFVESLRATVESNLTLWGGSADLTIVPRRNFSWMIAVNAREIIYLSLEKNLKKKT